MNPVKDTIKKVRETLFRYRMIDPGDRLIVAVSGGPDSVCLLDILHELRSELKTKLVVAHYNHGLREAEDEFETQFVQNLADTMHLPFDTEKASSLKSGGTSSLEERARNARYDFFERLQDKHHADKIAVGHNLNDQAETVLMRLLRGSGPTGLAGIPPCRDGVIIRPLIGIKRKEIASYIKAQGLSYVIDSSNLDAGYLRNKIRLELLPSLLEYQPRLVEHLGQLAAILREENDYLQIEADHWVEKEAELKPDGEILVHLSSFLELPRPLRNRVIRKILMELGKGLRRIGQMHVQSIHELVLGSKPQGMLNLPNGILVQRRYNELVFTRGMKKTVRAFRYLLDGPGTFDLEKIGRSISLIEMEGCPIPDPEAANQTACLDAEKIRYPLIIRNFRPGDRFVPLGMRGHRKIKDFFIDLKVSSETRALIPILMSRDIPVWICGYRIDDRFKVTPDTKKTLKITLT